MSKYEVDVAKLKIGESLTYKQLCSRMGWKYDAKAKSVKHSQLESLSHVVEYHEEGKNKGKRIIIDAFKSGLDYDRIKQALNGSNLDSLIMRAIIEQLWLEIQNNEHTTRQYGYLDSWYVTQRQLKQKIGLCQQRLDHVKKNVTKFCETYELDKTQVYDVLECNKNYINGRLNKCLQSLEKDYSLITKTNSFIIECRQLVVNETLDDIGVIEGELTNVIIKADQYQTDFIRTVAIPNVLNKVGVQNLSSLIYNYDKYQEFYRELPRWVDKHCQDIDSETQQPMYPISVHDLKGCVGVFECLRIGFGKEVIQRNYEDGYKLTDGERELISIMFQQSELGDDVVTTIDGVSVDITKGLQKNGKVRHQKAKNQDDGKRDYRKDESYLKTVDTIAIECHSSLGKYTNFGGSKGQNHNEKIIVRKNNNN